MKTLTSLLMVVAVLGSASAFAGKGGEVNDDESCVVGATNTDKPTRSAKVGQSASQKKQSAEAAKDHGPN